MKAPATLRAVALYEAAKGALVLAGGCGLLRFAHLHAQHFADELVRHLHLNPANAHPRIFERLLLHVTDALLGNVLIVAVLARRLHGRIFSPNPHAIPAPPTLHL